MLTTDPHEPAIGWQLTTWEGARREKMRHWALLSLEEVILAVEEMQAPADWLAQTDSGGSHRT